MRVDRIKVDKGRLNCVLFLSPDQRYTTPDIMRAVLADYPRLERHTCVNAKGPTFAAVMNHTSVAHVLEHLVIDLQAQAHLAQGDQRDLLFVGNTQWVDEAAGIARVQVKFFDDLIALKAVSDAVAYLNHLLD